MPYPPSPLNHRNVDLLLNQWPHGSRTGLITLTTAATELKISTGGALPGRSMLFMTNDSSYLLYVSNTSNVSSSKSMLIPSGGYVKIAFQPTGTTGKAWGRTYAGTVSLHMTEVLS
jgi:hypothetical protein